MREWKIVPLRFYTLKRWNCNAKYICYKIFVVENFNLLQKILDLSQWTNYSHKMHNKKTHIFGGFRLWFSMSN